MNYTGFLFSSLLREFNANYNNLPYDEMYDKHRELLEEYENSKFNVDDIGEYKCMTNFFEDKNVGTLNF